VTHTILSQHVNKCNTAAANIILSVIFSFKKSQSVFVCPSAKNETNTINTCHKSIPNVVHFLFLNEDLPGI